MSQLNLYYRAFKEYRKYTLPDKACIKQRQQIKQNANELDKLETIRTVCIIDEEWVKQIEIGLPFVEKAIAEERQFIKNEGEVLDIEKIKRVSKDSVEHLARHSDLITHVPDDGSDIIPDKIYMVERLSDYAVYENRFLYMMLCYLRDFIDTRLKKIKELGNIYRAETFIKRDVRTSSGRIKFESKFEEESKRDPYSSFDKNAMSLIERIESCQHIVTSLLAKPLMVIVSKSPMIKPPITKTNVLKMNTKFKNSVALYEYISSYPGQGYTIEQIKKTISPFTDELGDELAELINVTSFLTYEYGNELNEQLRREYENEELLRKEREREEIAKQLENFKQKLVSGEIDVAEYVMALENGIKEFRQENVELKNIRKDYDVLTSKHEELKQEKIVLNKKIMEVENENKSKTTEIENMKVRHEKELEDAEEKRVFDLEKQAEEFNERQKSVVLDCENQISQAKADCQAQIDGERNAAQIKYQELLNKHDILDKNRALLQARVYALTKQQGEQIENQGEFTSKENFEELETEFAVFYDLFDEQWKQTRKKIRKDLLWTKAKKIRDKI